MEYLIFSIISTKGICVRPLFSVNFIFLANYREKGYVPVGVRVVPTE